jgi:competence protein ComEC
MKDLVMDNFGNDMNKYIILFLLGDLYLQTFASLPSGFELGAWIFLSGLCLFLIILIRLNILTAFISSQSKNKMTFLNNKKYFNKLTFSFFAFCMGFIWSVYCACSLSSWFLNKENESKPILASGSISSLPSPGRFGKNFEFHLDKLRYQSSPSKIEYPNALIRLTSPEKLSLKLIPGDKWQFLVHLKRIHGVQSPGAFDYEAWAFQKGIRASGTILDSQSNILLSQAWHKNPIAKLRQALQEKILLHSPHSTTSPWLMALMIGERNGITQNDWQVLRNTGTNHLMAIGGLHIGILAGFAYSLASWLWRRFPALMFVMPAQQLASYAALLTVIIYSSLSGFLIPTQRASIMLTIFISTVLVNRKINPWNAWSLALFFVLIINPMSVLNESFWLSFGTIALILYGMSHRLSPSGLWWKWGRVQWVIGVGLIPLSLALFQECSLASFLANSIAIPWLAFTILPLCFLSTLLILFLPSFASLLLLLADKSLSLLWLILSWIAQLPFSIWHLAIPNNFILIAMITGFVLLLLPAGFSGRYFGLIWIMPALLYQVSQPKPGEYWVTVLDAGQGLSVVVQTAKHILIYDAGPKLDASLDMGESVVLPYLRMIKSNKIDSLVISHGDNDHIGGAQAILKNHPKTKVFSSVPDKMVKIFDSLGMHPDKNDLSVNESFNRQVNFCKANYTWIWDNIQFSFLYPFDYNSNLGNDGSCVLLIDNGKHKILLSGDIEKFAEKELLLRTPEKLKADMIIAPHHGSKTSGLKQFIAAVNPEYVVYATGYRNRYHFPHQSVVASYEKLQVKAINTADSGTLQFKFTQNELIDPPEWHRAKHKKYWFES